MENRTGGGPALGTCHLESIDDQAGSHVRGCLPPDHLAGGQVDLV
jgi:hypothetical protein